MYDNRLAVVALAFAMGCGQVQRYDTAGWYDDVPEGEEATEEALEETPSTGIFDVSAVRPAFGSDAGGSLVLITGGPFDRFATVFIGGEEAAVVSATSDALTVETPIGVAGVTELEVVSGGGVSTHSFRYWPDATGLVGLKGSVEFVDVVGDYWADGGFDRARAEIALVEPVAFESWEAFSPTFNSCVSDWALPSDTPVDGLEEVTLVSADVRIDLESDADGFFGDQGVSPGESYDLEPSGDWDGVVLDDLTEVPVGLQVQSPALDVNVPRQVERQFGIEWDRAAPADYVAIVLEKSHLETDGSLTIEQKVSCAVPDAGSFTVPGSVWREWTSGDVIAVSVGRVFEGNGVVLPHNNATAAVSGIYWVSGAVRAE